MPLYPAEIAVGVISNTIGASYVGLSVDTPLPTKIGGTQHVVGILNLLPGVPATFQTTVQINVGEGKHYVILGYEIPVYLIPSVSSVALRIRMFGTNVSRTYTVLDTKQYIYILFEVDKNGLAKVIDSGEIAPGGSPVQSPGGGGLFPGDIGESMSTMIMSLMEVMLPMMMMSMMLNMITSMFAGLGGMV